MFYARQIAFVCLALFSFIVAANAKPKYGREATPLSKSHDYIRSNTAADFWALIPYYTAQQDDRSCSLATLTMLVNAARNGKTLTSDDELVTQKGLLAKVKNDSLQKGVGPNGHGVNLDQLADTIEESLKAYEVGPFKLEVVHTSDTSKKTKEKLHQALVANEKSANDFIVINFIQGAYTGDADIGHIAPIAAYDGKTKKVLVLDPDRQWYEPYWVSEETLLGGMATQDKNANAFRGYIWVHLNHG